MHDEWSNQLSAYLDGELDAEVRRRLEAHLVDCAECRATLGELRRVVAWAPTYAGAEPSRDLWAGILDAIDRGKVATFEEHRPPAPRRRFTWAQLAAAALAMAVLGGGGAWLLLRQSESPVAGPRSLAVRDSAGASAHQVAFADRQYDAAVADLERVLAEGRSKLDTATVRIVEESLHTIDRAIAEARSAIQRDSANAYLSVQVAANMRRKLAILRQAARAIAAES